MTERLYYRDPSVVEFEAIITSVTNHDGQYITVLDRSAFYPTSGGQQHDSGLLNGIEVFDVIDADSDIQHVTGEPIGTVGEKVRGAVNRERRRRHRQQHTAQHIVSQVFIQLFAFETVSVHLGEEYGAIELNAALVESAQLVEVERRANEIVQSHWPVEILFVSGDDLARLPLRKVPSREGTLRVIKIGEFDWSACGGTHCASTSEVGLIKIIGAERVRGHALVKFLAGSQALDDYAIRFEVTDSLSKSLTCHVSDLPLKVGKLADDNKSLRKEVSALQKELIPIWAHGYSQKAVSHGSIKVLSQVITGIDASTAGQLAAAVADLIGGLVLFIADSRLLIAVGQETGLHAGNLAKALGTQIGLKGGGSNRAAQLGGADESKLDQYAEILLTVL